jgi:hypothetical protein
LTFTSSTGGFLATDVAQVLFSFTTGNPENGWEGYSEIDIYGTPIPRVNAPSVSGGNLVLAGTGGTPGGSYTWLTSTNLAAPLITWATNSTGAFDGAGAFSNAIPINPSEPALFYLLRVP